MHFPGVQYQLRCMPVPVAPKLCVHVSLCVCCVSKYEPIDAILCLCIGSLCFLIPLIGVLCASNAADMGGPSETSS